MPPLDSHSYPSVPSTSFPPHNPRQHSHLQRPIASVQDPDVQLRIAEAVQHLSSLLSAVTGVPPGQGISFPLFPLPSRAGHWPSTPSRPRYTSRHSDAYGSEHSEAGSSSPYASSSRHGWPYSSDQFSEGTLPPSSPLPSSSPAAEHHKPFARERSRSRGFRVSFHIDDNDKPLPPTPQRDVHSDDEIAQGRNVTPGAKRRDAEPGLVSAMRPQARSKSVGHGIPARSSMTRDSSAGKGKGRADTASASEDEEDVRFGGSSPSSSRHTRAERGRTPGPPSRQERSQSVHAGDRKIRGSSRKV